jgi:hypothetical protein
MIKSLCSKEGKKRFDGAEQPAPVKHSWISHTNSDRRSAVIQHSKEEKDAREMMKTPGCGRDPCLLG